MRNIVFTNLVFMTLFFGCEKKQDCSVEIKKINDFYDNQIQANYNNPKPDLRKIESLKDERVRKLAEACK